MTLSFPPTDDSGSPGPREALDALAPLLKHIAGDVEVFHHGNSMLPTLPNGTSIRVQCKQGIEPQPGKVVALRAGDGVVSHRLLYRGRRPNAAPYIITRGDANWLPDAPIPADSVLGVVTQVAIDGEWCPVGSHDLTGVRALAGNASLAALRMALELHIRLARIVFDGMKWVERAVRSVRRSAD